MSPDPNTLEQLRIDRDSAPERGSVGWLVGLVLFVLLLGGLSFWWFKREKPVTVRTVVVSESGGGGSSRTLLNASGYVTARREATVSSKITGKVMEVLVEEGMEVKEGQILARLDSSNVDVNLRLGEAQLEAARSALHETQANLELAERELKRAQELAAEEIASQSDLERAETQVKALRSRLERQEAEVAVADRQVMVMRQQLEDTIIRAPFDGVVISKNAQPGEMISPMSSGGFTRTGICTIVDMSSLEIEVDVNESYINRVQPGQPVEAVLDSYPDWKIPARVIAIIPTADRQKATVKVRVGFDEMDSRVLPDMGVKVAFQGGAESPSSTPQVRIPSRAVRERDGREIVWVVKDGHAERRAITAGLNTGEQTTILAGLSGGERVVIEGAEQLADGTSVKEAKE
jgi:RND family efflux transporter MFP subunit